MSRQLLLLVVASSAGTSWADFLTGEVISDLTTSSEDEGRALEIKSEQFWKPILEAAEELHLDAHDAVVQDATRIASELPEENSYVREALLASAGHLRNADAVVMAEAVRSAKVAAEQMGNSGGDWNSLISSWGSGPNFMTQALRRFVDGGRYSERLLRQVADRQAEILPALTGVSKVTGNVLSDCRLASKRAFDLLKYDIYNKGVPKTPEAAKAVAHRLVEASGESRHRFSRLIIEMANGIARDVQGRTDAAGATIARSSLLRVGQAATPAPAPEAETPQPPLATMVAERPVSWGAQAPSPPLPTDVDESILDL
jgi:hypothetical protein